MSWSTSGILIQQDLTAEGPRLLERLGFAGLQPQDEISLDEATSRSLDAVAISMAPVKGWTAVFNCPDMFGSGAIPDEGEASSVWVDGVENQLVELSRCGSVYGFLVEGMTGTYGFTVHQKGKRIRTYLHVHQQIVIDEGKPLRGEHPGIAEGDMGALETAVLNYSELLGLPFFDLEAVAFQVYTYSKCPS